MKVKNVFIRYAQNIGNLCIHREKLIEEVDDENPVEERGTVIVSEQLVPYIPHFVNRERPQ